MFASLVSTPVVVSLARADGVASSRASRASASVPTVASSPRGDADRVALTRRGILGAAALAAFASPAPAHARRANKFADLSSLSPAQASNSPKNKKCAARRPTPSTSTFADTSV